MRGQGDFAFDVFGRQDRAAGGDAAHQRHQAAVGRREPGGGAGQGTGRAGRGGIGGGEGLVGGGCAPRVGGCWGLSDELDAARGGGRQADVTFAFQRAQMVFGGIGRTEAQLAGDFGPGGRPARLLDGLPDEIQDLGLSGGEFQGHVFRAIVRYWMETQPVL